jgi:hypothetical protein
VVKCMLMSLKNDQPRCYGKDHVSPHKDYNKPLDDKLTLLDDC